MADRPLTRVLRCVAGLLLAAAAFAGAQAPARSPFDAPAAAVPRNAVDEAVFARLKKLGIQPARPASDAVFLRRVFLDVIGVLPTVEEARNFLDDPSPAKRSALVDRLLERREFAEYWAMKWGDVLRVKSEFPINLWPNAVQAYHAWITASLRDNVPFDRFARALLTSSGSNFRVPPVNFYRAVQSREPKALAANVALVFMGTRFESWPADRQASMAAFFSQLGYKPTGEWKEEIVYFDSDKAPAPDRAAAFRTLTLPDGTTVRVGTGDDPREAFATWLVSPRNTWFARAAVNRIWFWLMGRGIVQEADDLRPDNPPANPALLALLEREFQASRFDLKQLYRLILNSSTYQLSPIPPAAGPEAEASFAHALIRPLDAEVLADAVCQVTGSAEQYSSAIPEPYTYIPPDVRAVSLADGSIRSAFLETFGRPSRDTGRLSERNSRPTAAQRLFLLNSGDIQRKLQQGPAIQALLQAPGTPRDVATRIYLAILSRFPTDGELQRVGAYGQAAGSNRRQVGLDLAWALVNSSEFRFRH
jgi:hypothetical protein